MEAETDRQGLRDFYNHAYGTMTVDGESFPGASKKLPLWPEVGLALRIIQESGLKMTTRASTADARMIQHRPTEPRFYLFTIDVLRAARSQGLGRKLMEPTLAVVDRVELPVYLENSNPGRTSFYQSQKFVRQQTFSWRRRTTAGSDA